ASFLLTGIDGTGKTTTLTLIEKKLNDHGRSVLVTTGTELTVGHDRVDTPIDAADSLLIDDAERVDVSILTNLIASRSARGRQTVLAWNPIRGSIAFESARELGLGAWAARDMKLASLTWGHESVDSELIAL